MLNVAGALVVPVISFYIPIILNFLGDGIYKLKRNKLWVVHDLLVFLAAMAVQFLALKYSIEVQILGN